jgi:cytochrome oxidase assembly protein ShyY1
MYRFLYAPKWILLHLAVALGVFVMVNLGFWQIDRLHQRQDFNAIISSRFDVASRPLDAVRAEHKQPRDAEWLKVQITGQYLSGEDIVIVNVSQDGQAGKNIVTPLQLPNGEILLVNRGFVSLVMTPPVAPSGNISIEARLRQSATRQTGAVTDSRDGDLREAQRIDIGRLTPQLPGPAYDMYVDMLGSNPADSVDLSQIASPILSNGTHLSYAVQWFFFSVCAIAGWLFAIRREVKQV